MPKKLILKDFELVEISGVDKPAQPTAKMTIMKKADKDLSTIEKGGTDMSDELKVQIEELQKQLDALKASNDSLQKMASLSDEEKAFIKAMSKEEEKEEFLEMDEEKRKEKVAKAKSEDASIVVAGQTITKSVVGDQIFAVFKAQQEEIDRQRAEVQKAKDDAEMAELVKRASEEYSTVPGTPEEIAGVLKAVSTLDEVVQKNLEAIFNVAKGGASESFETKGAVTKSEPKASDALSKLDELAKAYAKDNSVGYAKAYSEVISKHADLYQESVNVQN